MTRKSRLLQSHWRVRATIEEVAEILGDVERLPDWWGDVYLDVTVLDPGGEDGLGREINFHSRGFLPYTLRWQGTVVEADRPHRWSISAKGDMSGTGTWMLTQDGQIADIRYDWYVDVSKPLLKQLASVLWPVFAANHRWAMMRGLAGLEGEIERRRAN